MVSIATLQPRPEAFVRWLRVAVGGPSMLPTLAPGDWLLVRRGAQPRPGAVLVVRQAGRLVVKRAIRETPDGWWVEGDNDRASDDSRTYGAVPATDVIGEVRFRCYPLRAVGRVR